MQMKSRTIWLAFAILMAFFGCRSTTLRTVPEELIGVWQTAAPKYADRFFELTKQTIVFGTGEGNGSVHTILKIKETREDEDILYTIYYRDHEALEYEFPFYYDPVNGGTIRFKNQKEIEWTKDGRIKNQKQMGWAEEKRFKSQKQVEWTEGRR